MTTQAMTYVAEAYAQTQSSQSIALAILRCDFVPAYFLCLLADRTSRVRIIGFLAIASSTLTVLVGITRTFNTFVATQFAARALATALAATLAIHAAEVAPADRRGRLSALLVAAAGLGSGITLAPLALADRTLHGWRLMYLAFAPALLLGAAAASRLPHPRERIVIDPTQPRLKPLPRARYLAVALGVALMTMYVNPSTQLLNEYLRKEREYTSSDISLFLLLTNVTGAAAILLFGGFSDRFGRRRLLRLGFFGYLVANLAAYQLADWPLWLASSLASLAAAIALPVVPLLPSELSRTKERGARSGSIVTAGRLGGIAGLALAAFALREVPIGTVMLILSIPCVAGVLIMRVLPTTERRDLSD